MLFQPNISVIIPLYNHERYIDATLDSVLAQTVLPKEIIVIDDGSQDGSLERLRLRAAQEPRIIYWSHPNQGAHNTINAGLRRATGDYVAILNSDDCFHPRRLEMCLNALEHDTKADVVCSELSFLDGEGNIYHNKWYVEALAFYRKVGDISLALINGNFLMTTSNLFVRRTIFEELGYFSNLRYAHDLDFFLRLILKHKPIVFLEAPLLQYRIHASNTISEGVLKVKIEWAAVVAWFAWQIEENWGSDYVCRLMYITDRHNLTRLIFYFFKQFQRTSPQSLMAEIWLEDAGFREFITKAVR